MFKNLDIHYGNDGVCEDYLDGKLLLEGEKLEIIWEDGSISVNEIHINIERTPLFNKRILDFEFGSTQCVRIQRKAFILIKFNGVKLNIFLRDHNLSFRRSVK